MPRFKQQMIETRTYLVEYEVVAKDELEAADKIAIGDTVGEDEIRMESVISRDPYGQMEEIHWDGDGPV